MLGKLIKYEWKSMGRILFPLFGITLFMSLLSGVGLKYWDSLSKITFMNMLVIVIGVLFAVIIFATLAGPFVVSIYRFKKNLFDGEGYLMNTLPVSSEQNIVAKMIVSVIFEILAFVAATLSGLVFSAVLSYIDAGAIIHSIYNEILPYVTPDMYGASLELAVLCIAGFVAFNSAIYAAIAIGHSAAERKVLKSVGAYVLIYMATQIVSGTVIIPLAARMEAGGMNPVRFMELVFALAILIEVVYSLVWFAVTDYFMKKKLNLQ